MTDDRAMAGECVNYEDRIAAIVEILRQDYARFPKEQTYEIYDADVYFKDPTSEFRGVARYRQTIAFIDRWFRDPQLDLHEIRATAGESVGGYEVRTDWTLTWTTPLPWSPRVAISGWSELEVDLAKGDRGAIVSHVDFWHCSIWEVVRQHFP